MNENFGKSATHKNILKLKLLTVSLLKIFNYEIANLEMHNKLDTNIKRNPNYNYENIATLLQNAKK